MNAGPTPRGTAGGAPTTTPVDTVVLAGGTSSRWDGVDKTQAVLRGRTLLDHALDAAPLDGVVVVVGPRRPVGRVVTWTREEPAGAGPAAGLQAGVRRLAAGTSTLVLAADLPRAADLAAALLATPLEHEARVVVDQEGRPQWTAALLSPAAAETVRALPDLDHASLHSVFERLSLDLVAAPAGATHDLDTPDDLARAARPRQEDLP